MASLPSPVTIAEDVAIGGVTRDQVLSNPPQWELIESKKIFLDAADIQAIQAFSDLDEAELREQLAAEEVHWFCLFFLP